MSLGVLGATGRPQGVMPIYELPVGIRGGHGFRQPLHLRILLGGLGARPSGCQIQLGIHYFSPLSVQPIFVDDTVGE